MWQGCKKRDEKAKTENYPDANPLNMRLAKVAGKSRGPSITIKVMAGDTISVSAKAFYNMDKTLPGQGVDIAPVLGSAIAAISNPTGAVVGEAAQLATDLGATASQSVALTQVPKKDDHNNEKVQPESGINFVLYNDAFEVIPENTGVLLVEDKINEIQILATDKMVMQESGFLEVYVDNQAQTPVFFDNLILTATTGPVMEVNAYYPFGMMIPDLSTIAGGDRFNAYKYNGKELQNLMNLYWLDYGARMLPMYFPVWMVPDPLAEKYYSTSPYAYVMNNPIKFVDPDGMSADGFTVDKDGHFKHVNDEGGEEYDVIYKESTYKSENRKDYDDTGKKDGMKVSKDFMNSEKVIKNPEYDTEGNPTGVVKESHRYEVKSDEEASKILEFMGKNTTVEWGNTFLKDTNGGSINFLQTSHENSTIIGTYYSQQRYVNKGYKVVRFDHTHPYSSKASPADYESGKATLGHSPNAKFRVLYRGVYYPFYPKK